MELVETGGEREPQDWGWLAGQEECACCQAAFKRGYVGSSAVFHKVAKHSVRRGEDRMGGRTEAWWLGKTSQNGEV